MTDERLEELDRKIDRLKSALPKPAPERQADNVNQGVRAGTELVVCIAGGAGLGLLLDRWLETGPLFLIIFLLSGVAAGFMNVYRISNNMGAAVGFASLHQTEKKAKKAPENEP